MSESHFDELGIFPDLSGWDERSTPGRKPWHRPRKQLVRERHLRGIVKHVFERKPADQKDRLKYLGLPGEEFLDIRYLLQLDGSDFGGTLPDVTYIGFDTAAAANGSAGSSARNSVNARSVDVDSLPRIRSSRVVKGDIRSLGHKDGTNRRLVHDSAPFDVVNLDFCNSALADPPERSDSLYKALAEIFAMQRTAFNRWGLMITTRVNRNSVDPNLLDVMRDILRSNVDKVSDFSDVYSESFERDLEIWPQGDGEGFRSTLLLAIYKWVSSVGVKNGMDVKLYAPLAYQVDPLDSCYDIASCAFVFKRRSDAIDPLLLESRLQQGDWPDEKFALDAIMRVKLIADVDHLLSSDENVFQRCVSVSKQLLAQAGVDVTDYEQWSAEVGGV